MEGRVGGSVADTTSKLKSSGEALLDDIRAKQHDVRDEIQELATAAMDSSGRRYSKRAAARRGRSCDSSCARHRLSEENFWDVAGTVKQGLLGLIGVRGFPDARVTNFATCHVGLFIIRPSGALRPIPMVRSVWRQLEWYIQLRFQNSPTVYGYGQRHWRLLRT